MKQWFRKDTSLRFAWLGAVMVAVFALSNVVEAAPQESPGMFSHLTAYNTRIVLMGTTLLGMCGGLVGVFMLLRNRSLVGDVVGHSALPGIAMAFILTQVVSPGTERSVPVMMVGALIAGLMGAVSVLIIDRWSLVKSDAALAIVLSLFYGTGTALFTVVQQIPTASAAGLDDYLFGKTAALVAGDVWIFAISAAVLAVITFCLFKELCLVCFDEGFAAATGWPVFWLDTMLTGLVVGVTIIGMQSVGLLLVVAILIIPAASAKFWSNDLWRMTVISCTLGGGAAFVGTVISASSRRVSAGAVIVLSGSLFFILSLLFGWQNGIVWKWWNHWRLKNRIGRLDLLRAMYESVELAQESTTISDATLLHHQFELNPIVKMRSWSRADVSRLINQVRRRELVESRDEGTFQLTPDGAVLARRAVRNHRLWEMYLITYAEIAPSHVDRDADLIEHVLDPEVIRELEHRMTNFKPGTMLQSPHSLEDGVAEES